MRICVLGLTLLVLGVVLIVDQVEVRTLDNQRFGDTNVLRTWTKWRVDYGKTLRVIKVEPRIQNIHYRLPCYPLRVLVSLCVEWTLYRKYCGTLVSSGHLSETYLHGVLHFTHVYLYNINFDLFTTTTVGVLPVQKVSLVLNEGYVFCSLPQNSLLMFIEIV